MDHLGNAKESEDFYEIDKTLLRSRTQNIEILYNEIIQRYNGNIGQGSMMMANKQDDRLMDFGDAEDEIDVKIIQEKKLHTSN